MIQEFDPDASIEKRFTGPTKSFSYDVFSPRINALIEMHGRVWHDLNATPPKLAKMVEKNVENDRLKEALAKAMKLRYEVFWDDQQDSWSEKLEELYGHSSAQS
jgi:hypothetical protein